MTYPDGGLPHPHQGGVLDLILTNMPEKVSNIAEVGRLGKSDHYLIQFDLEMSQKNSGEKRVFRNWKKADWDKIRQGLETTVWLTAADEKSAEDTGTWQQLRRVIDGLVAENVPLCEFKPRKTDWMTGDILREVRRKRRLWKKARNGGSRRNMRMQQKK